MPITRVASQVGTTVVAYPNASTTVAFPNNVTAGNLIVIVGSAYHASAALTSITVSQASGTATIGSVSTVYGTNLVWNWPGSLGFIAYAVVTGSGSLTMQVATSQAANNGFSIATDEFAGINTASPLDVNGGEASITGTTTPVDTITTLTAGALILGLIFPSHTFDGGITPGSGYTQIAEDEMGNVGSVYNAEFRIVTTPGTYNVDWVNGFTANYHVLNVAIKPAAAAAPVAAAAHYAMHRGA